MSGMGIGNAPVKHSRFADSAIWGTIACGAGLFSDGYLNAIIGPVSTILGKRYAESFKNSKLWQSDVSSIAFAGTVLGQLFFGYTSDHISRKWSLLVSTIILIVFAILSAGAYGAGGTPENLIKALVAYRFLLGVGIGGEYPAGSVGAAEHSGSLKSGTRNRMFIMFTNVQIDLGFVVAPLSAMIIMLIAGEQSGSFLKGGAIGNLSLAWRLCLGLGAIPPIGLLILRFKVSEPEPFQKEKMSAKDTPWLLCIKYYGFRLLIVSLIWFIYDFSSYSFGIYSSDTINTLRQSQGGDTRLWVGFGWSTLISFFYMPGCILGAYLADTKFGPKNTLIVALILQSIVAFVMAACYRSLAEPSRIAGFVIVYGLFLALGEVGPGDNIGLFASKTSSTHIRGKYYGLAAAVGKIGAYAGAKAMPAIGLLAGPQKATAQGVTPVVTEAQAADNVIRGGQYMFYAGASLAILAAALAFCLPSLEQDVIANEDIDFRRYLESQGYDTSVLGVKRVHSPVRHDVEEQIEHPDKQDMSSREIGRGHPI